ncbi:MAG: discoidin domain-containing protein [Clostridia bacterium]|nr:discoidin domain-containing protein [Clostridia bacterium]
MKKRILATVLCCMLALTLGACGNSENNNPGLPDGDPSVTAMYSRKGYSPAAVIDGDTDIGWIGGRKASETNFQVLTVDFGKTTAFSSITLDDTFSDGYTNTPPEYLAQSVSYGDGDASGVGKDATVSNVLQGVADGRRWCSADIPTEDAPQWIWITLGEPTKASRIELDNEVDTAVFENYEVYYSEQKHSSRDPEQKYKDPADYTLLHKETAGESNVAVIETEEEITVSDLLIRIYSQTKDGEPVVASLDEIFLFGNVPEGYSESHQPVRFTFSVSNDGKTFDVICEESANYSDVWRRTFDTPVSCRFVRYVVFEEMNNNYPSIGELTFA